MRRCPHCQTINSDGDSRCGVCGASLLGVASVTVEEAVSETREESAKAPPLVVTPKGSYRVVIVGVASGSALLTLGVLTLPIYRALPVFAIVFGGILLVSALGAGASRYRPSQGGRGGYNFGGTGLRYVHREAAREEKEKRKRESGDAD